MPNLKTRRAEALRRWPRRFCQLRLSFCIFDLFDLGPRTAAVGKTPNSGFIDCGGPEEYAKILFRRSRAAGTMINRNLNNLEPSCFGQRRHKRGESPDWNKSLQYYST